MNFKTLLGFVDRLSVNYKLIGVAALMFFLGRCSAGVGVAEPNGRFQLNGENMVDTRTGQIYVYDHNSGRYKRGPALPGWF